MQTSVLVSIRATLVDRKRDNKKQKVALVNRGVKLYKLASENVDRIEGHCCMLTPICLQCAKFDVFLSDFVIINGSEIN